MDATLKSQGIDKKVFLKFVESTVGGESTGADVPKGFAVFFVSHLILSPLESMLALHGRKKPGAESRTTDKIKEAMKQQEQAAAQPAPQPAAKPAPPAKVKRDPKRYYNQKYPTPAPSIKSAAPSVKSVKPVPMIPPDFPGTLPSTPALTV